MPEFSRRTALGLLAAPLDAFAAEYRREIEVPENWSGKRITLSAECIGVSRVGRSLSVLPLVTGRGDRVARRPLRAGNGIVPLTVQSNVEANGRQPMLHALSSGTRCRYGIVAALCLLPGGMSMAAQASAQTSSQQMEQQRRAQTQLREALEQSERRTAADQAEQVRVAQERGEQQRRAQAEADRRREAEQRHEELLAQERARAQQSNPPQTQDASEAPQMSLPEAAAAPAIASPPEPPPRRFLLMRQAGLALMVGASMAALFVLGRIVREWLAR